MGDDVTMIFNNFRFFPGGPDHSLPMLLSMEDEARGRWAALQIIRNHLKHKQLMIFRQIRFGCEWVVVGLARQQQANFRAFAPRSRHDCAAVNFDNAAADS
jgi:hypothetical protein